MPLQGKQVVQLVDRQEQQLGQIEIERREENLIFGRFVPGPTFSAVQPLFQEFEEAVNLQALSVVDELDTAIAALGLQVHTPGDPQRIEAHDVQIWSDGSITYRVGGAPLSAKDKDLESRQPVRAVGESSRLTSRSSRQAKPEI
jgi:hypothetical protein